MFLKIARSRAVARGAIAVLAVGVSVLAGLAMWSTSNTQRATARVGAVNERGVYWGQLFDHVNLEEDMMNAYVGALNGSQRAAFAQTIGGADPILTTLRRMGDAQDRLMAKRASDAYHDYTVALDNTLAAGTDPADLRIAAQRGGAAADAVLQLVSASLANDRQQTRIFNRAIDDESHRALVATTIAFAACLCLLMLCSAVLLSYQRRVERQADSHRHDSLHDALTGLPNRTLLADRTAAAMRAAPQHGKPVGMLLIDLNGFKQVNDSLGHRYGDLLLQQVASRLRIAVRDGDTVARIGGDEFAVLLPQISSVEGATEIARRVLAALRQPVGLDDHTLEISGSIGVAICSTQCDSTEQLLQHADVAMYAAKRGQLGVQVYSQEQSAEYPQQLTLPAELRRALDVDALTVHYQPQVNIGTGQICGVEALARWHHPVYGVIGPAEFIPVAEDGGLIDQLTLRILTQALDQCRQWRHDGVQLPIAVNLSARCLTDSGLVDTVAALLRENEIPPGMLTLEITESSAIDHQEHTIGLLLALRRLGVRLSLDDFGTGYASMIQLQHLPVDELKIDRCFVSRLTSEPTSRAIVRAILELARDLDLDVVAEGVEDQRTRDELHGLGCHLAQGYLFSEPLPAAELATCIARLGTTDERVSHGFVTSSAGKP
jgi:diguanylate cyclase (GGDEF)-like protein